MNWHWIFANVHYLWLLILVPLMAVGYFLYLYRHQPDFKLPSFTGFLGYVPTVKQRLRMAPLILRLLAVALIIVALARPQSTSGGQNVTNEGIDIIMTLDISGSMLAQDFKPNRVEAAKKVVQEFIDGRLSDRIGLVVFSGESFSQCPLTSDHAVLKNLLKDIEPGMLVDGTALGEGLATAVNRIKDSKAKSKVIILLTDGVNNMGSIAPETAGEIASKFNIRVYTIGVGTHGTAMMPAYKTPAGDIIFQPQPVQIDEDVLKKIANETGGKYFRATDNNKLRQIYNEIDKLEKTKIEMTEFKNYSEEFYPFVLVALAFLALEVILRYTVVKSIP
jgi:Ca-activated chloride channel homolog